MSDLIKAIAIVIHASVESKLEYLFKNNHKVAVSFLEKLAKGLPNAPVNTKGDMANFVLLAKNFVTDHLPFKDVTGNYTSWIILKLYTDKDLLIEDVSFKIGETLQKFDELKTKVQNKSVKIEGFRSDINSFKSFNELDDYIDELTKDKTAVARSFDILERPEGKALLASNDAKIFFKSGEVTIVILNTYAASKYFSSGTQWCTSDERMFDSYSKDDTLYVVLAGKEKFQFAFKHGQFMDVRDRREIGRASCRERV